MTKGNDKMITRYNQRIVEASGEAAQRNETQQEGVQGDEDKQGEVGSGEAGREQQRGKRIKSGAVSERDDRGGDRGATSSQDPEGSRHSRKISGGMEDEEEEIPDKLRKDQEGTAEEYDGMADRKTVRNGELEWAKRIRTDEKYEMGIVEDVRREMTTAKACRQIVEDMEQEGGLSALQPALEEANGDRMPKFT